MMRALQNAMRLQALRSQAKVVSSRIGTITSYDPSTFTARVQLQPDDSVTGWLPVASPWIGNGWGMFAAPNIDDMVEVVCIDGALEAGTIIGRFYNLEDLPLAVQSGEFWIVHASGAFFKLLNTGAVTFSDGKGATVTLNGDGTISSAGTWTHTGNLTATGTITGDTDVIGGAISLQKHPHNVLNVQPGGSTLPTTAPT